MSTHPAPDLEAAPRRWPVRLILVGIVFALVLPALVFVGVLTNRITTVERARSEQAAQAAALRAAETLDRELSNLTTALLALASSGSLVSGNLQVFHAKASEVASALGQALVLSDLDGNQLINTRLPFGAPTPRMRAMDVVRKVIETRRPAVSGLFTGGSNEQLAVAVMYPVLHDGQVTRVLAMSLQPAYLTRLLQQQGLPAGWLASVVDGDNRIVARSADADRFLGQHATRQLIADRDADRDLWVGTAIDGTPMLAATQRLRMADWRVGIGVDLRTIEMQLRSTLMLIGVTGAITLAIACALAWQLATSVSVPLQRLARAGARWRRAFRCWASGP